ncbi:putative dolichyl-diphosphooligosaccharide-protein glycosyltransferase [Monocercomonoides exilis]|uniref:putative dolichyl-diphosphooligosaccharide-protein glycosyltransferase n=1 Tax=Monocercomonoides exilis TaxID=2049356 RepID=UPI00355ABB28|nr:putative dolichyl-diphosphooligosaccharide-protein glycosyltransferase [Monocercomonoides exilis]|eukprot:MONOS_10298.1-p1 / transcript=MONOS_10298.1 / gene=MONOS_10298 / organism=Monocercomonoides_exilis_PA203 / gene_product=dolichyl-diphosphooligosaccharide-protein glycosyltransferase / transcript_product=dolichyl-diphosphooligosaccharide-protein glycosyltransferase / location=Mono_scaffold00462:2429-3902(-) / protein_length=407 / sequence_SO=supercontig / SO=protein_coding / is_pseudo=false
MILSLILFCIASPYLSVSGYNVEIWGNADGHEKLIEQLTSNDIIFEETDRPRPLLEFGEWRKDGVMIFTDDFDEAPVIDFVNSGRSVIIFLNEESEKSFSFCEELGVEISDSFDKQGKCHYRSPTQDFERDVSCEGHSFSVQNPAHAHYYSAIKNSKGKAYAFAIQGDNDARVVIFGSELFGADTENDDLLEVAVDLGLWAYHKRGVLRAREIHYNRINETVDNPPELAISDVIDFSIILETFDFEKQEWVGYSADDVQLEFSMLVPRIRKTLENRGKGVFGLTFKCPDIFGVYQFIVNYQAQGFTPINVTHQVNLRPLRHDEHPRYVTSAYPFYVASGIMCVAVCVVALVFASQAPLFKEHIKASQGIEKSNSSAPSLSNHAVTRGKEKHISRSTSKDRKSVKDE